MRHGDPADNVSMTERGREGCVRVFRNYHTAAALRIGRR
jgi:hypothetical protein